MAPTHQLTLVECGSPTTNDFLQPSTFILTTLICLLTGYPYNLDFDYGALAQLQHFSINNLGDPFIESNYGVHSRQFEVGVMDWFARLWDLEKDEYWGYITNCGTEGNLHGILVGSVLVMYIDAPPFVKSSLHLQTFLQKRSFP